MTTKPQHRIEAARVRCRTTGVMTPCADGVLHCLHGYARLDAAGALRWLTPEEHEDWATRNRQAARDRLSHRLRWMLGAGLG